MSSTWQKLTVVSVENGGVVLSNGKWTGHAGFAGARPGDTYSVEVKQSGAAGGTIVRAEKVTP